MHLALGRGTHDSGQGMPDPLRETGYSGVGLVRPGAWGARLGHLQGNWRCPVALSNAGLSTHGGGKPTVLMGLGSHTNDQLFLC